MKNILKNIFLTLFVLLIVGNGYIFVRSMRLSADVNHFVTEIDKYKNENTRLKTEVFHAGSLDYAASMSALLKFTQKSQPLYFEQLKYALNR